MPPRSKSKSRASSVKTRSASEKLGSGEPFYGGLFKSITTTELAGKTRKGRPGVGRATSKSPPNVNREKAGPTLKSWALEVLQVLDKPTVALCTFIFGVIIIVVASKQLKMTFNFLTLYWGGTRPEDGFIGNFMVVFVFLYVWLDIVILQWLKEVLIQMYGFAYRRYCQLVEALEKIQEQDEYEELQRRRLMRQKKALEEEKIANKNS